MHGQPHAGSARIPVEEHRRSVRELLTAIWEERLASTTRTVALNESRGERLASDVHSTVQVPPAANSQMDGFVYRTSDLALAAPKVRVHDETVSAGGATNGAHEDGAGASLHTASLALGAYIAAGHAPGVLSPGEARPIMTGAPLPGGADAVIPVEETPVGAFHQLMKDTEGSAELPSALTFTVRPEHRIPGRFVRAAGSDTDRGDRVACAGDLLTPRLIGHLASVGVEHVEVRARFTAVVVSTGSELAQPGRAPEKGQIYDSNAPALAAALEDVGVHVARQLRVADDPHELLTEVQEAVAETGAHLIVSSGGVSAGALEPIRQLAELDNAPVRIAFDKVAMQPGGPQGLGVLEGADGDAAWIALPGNPVSALVSVEMFLREPLGGEPRPRVRVPVRTLTGEPESSPAGLLQVRRARLTRDSTARFVGGPSSHLLGALALSDALVLVAPECDTVHDRDEHEVMILR